MVLGEDVQVLCVLTGGKCYRVQRGGREYIIEMHPVCGPTPMAHDDHARPLSSIPRGFWGAVDALKAMTSAQRQSAEIP